MCGDGRVPVPLPPPKICVPCSGGPAYGFQSGSLPAAATSCPLECPGNGGIVAHYTQVVWAKTTRVGCAVGKMGRDWDRGDTNAG